MLINNLFKKQKPNMIAQILRTNPKTQSLNIRHKKHTNTECKEHQSPEIPVVIERAAQRVLHEVEDHVGEEESEDWQGCRRAD